MPPLPNPPAPTRVRIHFIGGGPLDGGTDDVPVRVLGQNARFHERADGAYHLIAIQPGRAIASWRRTVSL